MKISKETTSILKTLAGINTNLLLKAGSKLSTISPLKTVVAEVSVQETFSTDFGIYDLNEFLGVLSLFSEPELTFNDKQIKISENGVSIKYFGADPGILTVPQKELKFPTPDVEFDIPTSVLAMAIKTASVLRSPDISFIGDGTAVTLQIQDLKNPSSNSFDLKVGETDRVFSSNLKVENLKMMSGDYSVAISGKRISRFTNKTNGAVFYIALESTSSIE